jgi:hypothetical protein
MGYSLANAVLVIVPQVRAKTATKLIYAITIQKKPKGLQEAQIQTNRNPVRYLTIELEFLCSYMGYS